MPVEFGEFFHKVCLNIDSPIHPDSEWEMRSCSQWPSGCWRGGGTLTEGLQCCDVDVNAHM